MRTNFISRLEMMSNKERKVNEWSRGVSIIILHPRQQIFCSEESKFSSNKVKVNLNTTQFLIKYRVLPALVIFSRIVN